MFLHNNIYIPFVLCVFILSFFIDDAFFLLLLFILLSFDRARVLASAEPNKMGSITV